MENWALKLGHPKFESWAFQAVFHLVWIQSNTNFLLVNVGGWLEVELLSVKHKIKLFLTPGLLAASPQCPWLKVTIS